MSRWLSTCVLAAALALGIGTAAHAADLDAFYGQPEEADALPPPEYTFGTGWYLRGDLTATNDAKPDVLGTLGDARDHRDWNYGIGGGVGYRFTDHLRADATADYFGTQKTVDTYYGDDASLAVKANLRRFDALANGYFDLGTWAGFTPYVGAGVGFAGIRLDGSAAFDSLDFGSAYVKFPGKTRYDFAWAAMAGVSYAVSSNLLIDVGYRYLDLGTYEVPRFLAGPFAQGLKTDLTSHQVRAGLRYMIY